VGYQCIYDANRLREDIMQWKMFILVLQNLQKKWNEICMTQLPGGKCVENDCFPRTLMFEMLFL
jgi:hypothetical protein